MTSREGSSRRWVAIFIEAVLDIEEFFYHKVLIPELSKQVANFINKSK